MRGWAFRVGQGALLYGALLSSGCGPVEYLSGVTFGASRTLAEAKAAQAPVLAPYEYTAATEYLQKSRELAGYARFDDAVLFGKKAGELAAEAVRIARARPAAEPPRE
jgi:hypothetical protein